MNTRTYTRCHDAECTARTHCQRWLTRHDRAPGIRHAGTLKPAWIVHTARCQRFIWQPQISVNDLILRGPAGWLITGWLLGQRPLSVPISHLNTWSHIND
jgi:hypothetical protein